MERTVLDFLDVHPPITPSCNYPGITKYDKRYNRNFFISKGYSPEKADATVAYNKSNKRSQVKSLKRLLAKQAVKKRGRLRKTVKTKTPSISKEDALREKLLSFTRNPSKKIPIVIDAQAPALEHIREQAPSGTKRPRYEKVSEPLMTKNTPRTWGTRNKAKRRNLTNLKLFPEENQRVNSPILFEEPVGPFSPPTSPGVVGNPKPLVDFSVTSSVPLQIEPPPPSFQVTSGIETQQPKKPTKAKENLTIKKEFGSRDEGYVIDYTTGKKRKKRSYVIDPDDRTAQVRYNNRNSSNRCKNTVYQYCIKKTKRKYKNTPANRYKGIAGKHIKRKVLSRVGELY